MYATVFTSLSKNTESLLFKNGFIFFSVCHEDWLGYVLTRDRETETKFTCYGHSRCGQFNQAGTRSYSLLLSSSMMIALVPMPTGLLIQLTCFHFKTSVIFATRLTTITCCYWWKLCIHCITVVESDQKLQNGILISRSLTICSFHRTAVTAACNSSPGIKKCLISATRHFPITNAKLAEYYFGWDRL